MRLDKIVRRIVGPIYPTARRKADAKRLENLEILANLVDGLLCEISEVAALRNEQADSVRQLGQTAYAFLCNLGIEE